MEYEIPYHMQTDVDRTIGVLQSVIMHATAYGFTLDALSLTTQGRCRVSLSGSLPPEEMEAFRGDIVEIPAP